MMKSSSLKQKRINKTVIYVTTIVAFIYIVAASGRYSLFPGELSVPVDNVIKETYADNGAVIIDASSKRAILIDDKGNCIEVLNADTKSGKATYYSSAAISEDKIYIGEYDRQENKAYLTTERIVEYDLDGQKTGTVLELKHTDNNRTAVPFIQDITINGNTGTALCVDAIKQDVFLMEFTPGDSAGENDIEYISTPLEYPLAAWFSQTNADSIVVRDKQSNFCLTDISSGASESFVSSEAAKGVPLIFADIDKDGKLALTFNSELEGTTIRFNGERVAIQIIFWMCCAWLTVCIAIFAIRRIRAFLRQKNYRAINKIFSVMLVVLICMFVVGFYSVSLLKSHEQNIEASLEGYAAVLYNDNSDIINACLEDYKDDRVVDPKLTREVETCFESNVNILDQLDYGFKFALVFIDEDGEDYIISDSSSAILLGEKISENFNEETNLIGSPSFSSRFSTVIASGYSIQDTQENAYGYLVAYQDMGIYIAKLKSDFLSRSILLISLLITIGFVVTEGKVCASCFAKRREKRTNETANVGASTVRSIIFFDYFSSSVNTTLLVLIIKEIIENASMGDAVALMSFSVAAINAGFIFGAVTEKLLMKIMPQKRALQLCCVVSAICYAICFVSVTNSKLLLFTLALFVADVALATIEAYCGLLAFCSQDKHQMNDAISRASVSGRAVAGVIAGLLASAFGNSAIQLLGVLACILLGFFITFNLPANLNIEDEDKKDHTMLKAMGKDVKLLFTDSKVLALLVCIFIPIALFSGYKSYIFPDVAFEAGISKSTISSIVAFCNALFFYASPLLLSGQKKEGYSSQRTLLMLCIGISTVFMLFCLNSSTVWMVLTIAVATITYQMVDLIVTNSYQIRAIQVHAGKENANIILSSWNKITRNLCTPVLLEYLLQMLGFSTACCICGAIGAVGLIGFLIINKKKQEDKRPLFQ